jgi:hypothetical protein
MNITFGEVMEGRQLIADYIVYQKSKESFTVLKNLEQFIKEQS